MEQFARIAAIVAGILFGGWALSSVIWVWTKKQIYAYGGSALSVVGIILMGLSIYKTIDVKAAPDGIGIKLAELEKLLNEQRQREVRTKLASIPSDFDKRLASMDLNIREQNTVLAQFRRLDSGDRMVVQRANGTVDPNDSSWIFPKSTTGAGGLIGAPFSTMKLADGTVIYNYFPDTSNPKYLQNLQDQIAIARRNGDAEELSSLTIRLAQFYQARGDLYTALVNYREGLAMLESQIAKSRTPEPEKK